MDKVGLGKDGAPGGNVGNFLGVFKGGLTQFSGP